MPTKLLGTRSLRYIIGFAFVLFFLHIFQLRPGLDSFSDEVPSRPHDLRLFMQNGRPKSHSQLTASKSSFDWESVKHHNAPESLRPLPTGKPQSFPPVQYSFARPTSATAVKEANRRRAIVKKTFLKDWNSYKRLAWMRDELAPISGRAKDTFGGWAATLIDALDTLWIMGLKTEFYEAVEAVAVIDWANTTGTSCNIFETTIRHLGGLLSAYDLSQEEVLLNKATELGDMLYSAFNTPNRLPPFWLDYEKAKNGQLSGERHIGSASVGSLSMEFTKLSQATGNVKYYDAISLVTDILEEHQNKSFIPGIWPAFFNTEEVQFDSPDQNYFTIGALADSLYEYLPKMHALTGGLEPRYATLTKSSLDTVARALLFRPMLPDNADILISGNARVTNGEPDLIPEGQHLGCFTGGMYALAGRLLEIEDYVDIGAKLTDGCIYMYQIFPHGIMPEIFNTVPCPSQQECKWDQSLFQSERASKSGPDRLPIGITAAREPQYILRPEAIESVFLMYRITGREEFREAAWAMWEAIVKATETPLANAAVADITVEKGEGLKLMDQMEVSYSSHISALRYANIGQIEFLACRDAEVFLLDLFASRINQS
jgi:mannosyl-oligosaccharide alpha-1,2-mannosidase